MPARRWDQARSAVADGTGRAELTFSHPGYGVLRVVSIAFSTTGSSTYPVATAYRNYAQDGARLATDRDGTAGEFVGSSTDVLWPSESVILVLTGATPGAVFSATLYGSLEGV